jgi:hypothetical protein
MVYELEHYQEKTEKMIKDDEMRDLYNRKYDDMDHVQWEPDKKLKDLWWFRASPSTDPHDSISAGVRVLSALEEKVTLQPLAANPETKQKANDNERVLRWNMEQVNKRRQGTVQRSVVRSSLKYDEVCVQVIDLDFQIKNKEAAGAETKREKAARRYGRFLVNTYHPNEVHVQHSNMMPEVVVLVQMRKAKDVMREYGKPAKSLKDKAENDEDVMLFDYWDYDDHVVWTTDKGGGGEDEIIREEHDLPFLPWVARVGGDIMESKQEHRRRPLLYAVNQSREWETQNIVKSLRVSGVIRDFSRPPLAEEGPMPIDARNTQVEAGDAGLVADVTPGNTLKPLPPNQMDPAMREVDEMIGGSIAKSTVSPILQGADIPSGTAFATLNLATQTAVGALKPAKELAEYALADIFTLFLLFAHYTQNSIDGYGTEKDNLGTQYVIEHNEISPNGIYLSVELKPDVPLDRMQRANTAMMMVQAGIYSKERALDEMGVSDPETVIKEVYFGTLRDAQIQNLIAMQQAQSQMSLQMEAQAAQMQMQQGAQQQQLGQEAIQNELAGAPGGPGFDPNQGGLSPQMAAPGATREGVTGEDLEGNPTFTGLGGV